MYLPGRILHPEGLADLAGCRRIAAACELVLDFFSISSGSLSPSLPKNLMPLSSLGVVRRADHDAC